MKLLAAALMISAVAGFHINSEEELIKKFGRKNIKFDQGKTKSEFCNQCMQITVSSTGGTLEHQPQRLGVYTVDGSIWENMVPFWKSTNNQYITPDPNSNPIMYYIKWVVSEMVGGFNAGVMNDAYTDGFNCPYEIPDQWQYEYQRQWYVDPTLKFTCTKTRAQWEEEQKML